MKISYSAAQGEYYVESSSVNIFYLLCHNEALAAVKRQRRRQLTLIDCYFGYSYCDIFSDETAAARFALTEDSYPSHPLNEKRICIHF